MADEQQVDQLLDMWEELRTKNAELSLDQFIAERLGAAEPRIVDAFRSQAESLALIDRRIDLAAGHLPNDRHAENPRLDELRLEELTPGLEPIPGYKIINRLGRGGFGEVWKASSPGGFHVALKFVPIGGQTGKIEERSLEVMRDIRHPHLLSIFGTWRVGNLLVIATELADRTLLDRLEEARKEGHDGIPKDELHTYISEAAKGIDYLNDPDKSGRMPVQHRDIKPQNLLLVGGCVKVGDFGLVRTVQYDVTGHTGSLTLAYAAPECFDGITSNRSDQYSLAITYCHLRGGRIPFDGTEVEVMVGHRKKQADLSMVPPEERPALTRALAKRPNDRWNSCSEFVQKIVRSEQTGTQKLEQALPTNRGRFSQRTLMAIAVVAIAILLSWIAYQSLVSQYASSDDSQPRLVKIRVISAHVPEKKPSGEDWDADSSGPDIFFEIWQNGTRIFKSSKSPDSLEATWNEKEISVSHVMRSGRGEVRENVAVAPMASINGIEIHLIDDDLLSNDVIDVFRLDSDSVGGSQRTLTGTNGATLVLTITTE